MSCHNEMEAADMRSISTQGSGRRLAVTGDHAEAVTLDLVHPRLAGSRMRSFWWEGTAQMKPAGGELEDRGDCRGPYCVSLL